MLFENRGLKATATIGGRYATKLTPTIFPIATEQKRPQDANFLYPSLSRSPRGYPAGGIVSAHHGHDLVRLLQHGGGDQVAGQRLAVDQQLPDPFRDAGRVLDADLQRLAAETPLHA